mmetsp:Transcript_33824/g.77204  ORF Transcript_33824/g.77204 Transcript_33824/m.77204 type:complete len:325 (+) Transcript_33824:55-1029(+)
MALWFPPLAVALLTSTLAQAKASRSEPVRFTDHFGVVVDDNGVLSKLETSSKDAWDAGASTSALLQGAHGRMTGFSFVVEATRDFMLGLCSDQSHQSPALSTLDFAAYVRIDNIFGVHESGSYLGEFGAVRRGDTITVLLNEQQKVEYRVNEQVRYTSQRMPTFPLYVKMEAYRHGPCARQVRWIKRIDCQELCRSVSDGLASSADTKVELEVRLDKLQTQLAAATDKNLAIRRELSLRSMMPGASCSRGEQVEFEQVLNETASLDGDDGLDCPDCLAANLAHQSIADAITHLRIAFMKVECYLAEVMAENTAFERRVAKNRDL